MATITGEGLITAIFYAVFRFALFRGEGLSDHAAEGDGTAAAVAGRHIRIRVGVVRARVDARDVQALNRFAVVVDGLEVFVDRNAVERAQHVARSANAIERRRANCRQTMRVFSEIGVDARVVILVLALDGFLQRLGGQAKAFREFFNGVCHHDIAILDQAIVDALGGFERHIPAPEVRVFERESGEQAFEDRLLQLAEDARLTEREREVFGLLARGRNARYIQETLVVSYNTVKTHVSHVYAKLGVHSQQELIDVVESGA